MRDLQIFILDLQGVQLGELDLTDSDDFALKLTKSIASINDLGRRNTSFSLDFEAPQTKNNNKLLAGLRFATATKEILGKKPCAIMVDGNQVDRGFLYPYESEFDGMYKLVFKGLNNDWVEQLQDVELNELNWRDYLTGLRTEEATELFSGARFNVLNGQNSVNTDLIYPYVNRNNGTAAADLRPQLHLRSIVLAMFEKIGYTVNSAFLESDWIKGGVGITYQDSYSNNYTHLGLSVDPAFQMTRDQQDLIGQGIEYSVQAASTSLDPNTWVNAEMVGNLGTPSAPNQQNFNRFPNLINTVVTDNNTRFNPVTSEFTVGTGGTFYLDFNFKFEYAWFDDQTPMVNTWIHYTGQNIPFQQHAPTFTWYVVKGNTSNTAIDGTILFQGTTSPAHANIQVLSATHQFGSGDNISVFLEMNDDAVGHVYSVLDNPPQPARQYWRLRISNESVLKIVPKEDVQLGDVFRINSHIPDGIKCLTLLQDFKTMFNLYFDVDVNRKVVFIEPRDDFYTGVTEDITEIIDFNTPPTLNYLSDYKNEIVFEYITDSKDKYLEQWNKINDKTYGQFKYIFGNNERFDKGQSVLSTTLISATIQEALGTAANPNDIMGSIIKEEYLDADNAAKPVNKNYGARVFQLQSGQQYTPAGVSRRTNSPFIVLTAMMEDYANTPTFEDRKLTFEGRNGLVWDYYRKTLANIEDTAILTLKLNLSLHDYYSWDLKKTYYINEPAEIAGYYITDKISNFNVTKETPTTVTLVKFRDFTPVTITGGVGNVNVITQNNPQPQPILCTVNGAIVDCLDDKYQKMFKL